MATKRYPTKLGVLFDYHTDWMGGIYYILNLLQAIARQPVDMQPEVIIYGVAKEGFEMVKKEVPLSRISYKKISTLYNNKLVIAGNYLWRRLTGDNLFTRGPRSSNEVIFPNPGGSFFANAPNRLFWIPDFQEKFYPEFFTASDLKFREHFNQGLISAGFPIVFSSKDAQNDFRKFYPNSKNPLFLLPFAVPVPDISDQSMDEIKQKFGLSQSYFITPNQLFVHKNHGVVIDAAALVKRQGYNCKFLFSGRDFDPRCPEYSAQLKDRITKYQLEDTICYLGLLDKKVLLKLISQSHAVIQPSLFEGWSTVVEEAKALEKQIIASNISVHKEQMGTKGIYFDPRNAEELAGIIMAQLEADIMKVDWDYSQKQIEFGQAFLKIIARIADKGKLPFS